MYLDRNKTRKARKLVERLRGAAPEHPALAGLEAALLAQEGKWKEARPLYEKLRQKTPGDADLERTYAEILTRLREWEPARRVYGGLLEKPAERKKSLWDYRDLIDRGAPRLDSEFLYFHRPASQRDYLFRESGNFWFSPWFEMGAGLAEEVYKKGRDGDDKSINRLLIGHWLQGTLYPSTIFSAGMRWRSTYYDRDDFEELDFFAASNFRHFAVEASYDWNHRVRDPVEALEKRGTRNRFRMKERLFFFDRLEAAHEIVMDWYYLDGKENKINGLGSLGYKTLNDVSATLVLWTKPYFAVNYHYIDGHWRQKFTHADEVIGFLPDEQTHAGGLYAEQRFGSWLELSGSVTRGSDRKRNADYLFWIAEMRMWLGERARLTFSYEYDAGDSGTAGKGNSQIFTTSMRMYL
jgi:hypothetical protein